MNKTKYDWEIDITFQFAAYEIEESINGSSYGWIIFYRMAARRSNGSYGYEVY